MAVTCGESRYAIELPASVLATVGELKSHVWDWERHYWHREICKLEGKDKMEGFKLEKQEL
eukprot:972094-Rhodomonas_salina.1